MEGGVANNAWYAPANWSGNQLPSAGDTIIITGSKSVQLTDPSGAPKSVTVDGNLTITGINAAQGGRIFDLKGATLTVLGTLTFDASSGPLTLEGGNIVSMDDTKWESGTLRKVKYQLGCQLCRVRERCRHRPLPSEPYLKVALHTAQASHSRTVTVLIAHHRQRLRAPCGAQHVAAGGSKGVRSPG